MVMGHSRYSCDWVAPMIFMIHMPLFFVVSGYLFNTSKQFKQMMKGNVRGLLIPYALYNLLFLVYWIAQGVIKTAIGHPYSWTECVLTPLWHTLGGVALGIFDGPTWFLLALVWCKMMCYYIHQGSRMHILITVLLWGGLFSLRINTDLQYPIALDCACAGVIWFEVGQLMRQYKDKIQIPNYLLLVLIPLGVIICWWVMNYQGQCNYILAKTGGLLGLIGTGAGLVSYFSICQLLSKWNLSLVTLVSKASIVVMCLHMFVNGMLEQVLHYNHHLLYTFVIDLLLTLCLSALYPNIQKYIPSLVGGRK